MSSGYGNAGELECDCYIASIPDCLTTLVLRQLITGQSYKVSIEDKFGNVETASYTASAGAISILLADFTDGWINPNGGDFQLTVENNASLGTLIEFTFGGLIYNCINLRVKSTRPIVTSYTL